MAVRSITTFVLTCVVTGAAVAQVPANARPRECPVVAADMSAWVTTKDPDVGIEIKHPADYEVKHWGSRSDSSGVSLAFRRNAVSTININELQGFYSTRGPKASVAPCVLRMRSGELALHVERTVSTRWDGRDTLYFASKAILTPAGKPRMLVDLGAPDSTSLLEQMAILRTIRFLNGR
jgi:hypothetical protein